MANILLGVTGSVAAINTELLFHDLKQAGHSVKIVATNAAQYFFDPTAIEPREGKRNRDVVILNEDEWPGLGENRTYHRGDPILHIELRRWADILLIAPLDANTLAKLACGLSDNCLTCVWRAWDRNRPVVLAPAMNTLMWENPLTQRHLKQIADDHCAEGMPRDHDLAQRIEWINLHCPNLKIVPPISKKLACDDVGMGAMAERTEIVRVLREVNRK